MPGVQMGVAVPPCAAPRCAAPCPEGPSVIPESAAAPVAVDAESVLLPSVIPESVSCCAVPCPDAPRRAVPGWAKSAAAPVAVDAEPVLSPSVIPPPACPMCRSGFQNADLGILDGLGLEELRLGFGILDLDLDSKWESSKGHGDSELVILGALPSPGEASSRAFSESGPAACVAWVSQSIGRSSVSVARSWEALICGNATDGAVQVEHNGREK